MVTDQTRNSNARDVKNPLIAVMAAKLLRSCSFSGRVHNSLSAFNHADLAFTSSLRASDEALDPLLLLEIAERGPDHTETAAFSSLSSLRLLTNPHMKIHELPIT